MSTTELAPTTTADEGQPVVGSVERPVEVTGEGGAPVWGSDLIVDLLRRLGMEYLAVMPGSTTRGIHDSVVNYAGNRDPQLVLCNHEMVAVSVARGYARVTGRPMGVLLHNVVGLLNAEMSIFDAWYDRVPMMILGGTGPMDASRRRPDIDWRHTALIQGNLVRDFTKWDDQPGAIGAIPEAVLRGYRIAMTQPQGPVYVCFDVDHQEDPVPDGLSIPDTERFLPAPAPVPPEDQLEQLADQLVAAELPAIVVDLVGRDPEAVPVLVELAELLAAPVVDMLERLNFPTPHELNFTGGHGPILDDADLVLGLDAPALTKVLHRSSPGAARRSVPRRDGGQQVATISLDEYLHRGWSTDYHALSPVDLPLLGDTAKALPLLLEACRRRLTGDDRERIDARRRRLAPLQAALRDEQRRHLEAQWDHAQITEERLLWEVWNAVEDDDFVFTGAKPRLFARGVVPISGPSQFIAGGNGGGAIGAAPGLAVGAGIGLAGTGRLPITIVGDGNLLSGIQALWTAAHYRVATLWVVNNNRSYYNDEDHQAKVARHRDRPEENRWVGLRLEDPEADFAEVARGLGVAGFGPVKRAEDLGEVLRRAADEVRAGRPALVDVWTENRAHG